MTNPTSTPTLSISQYKHGMETGVWPTTDTAAQPEPVPRPTRNEVKANKTELAARLLFPGNWVFEGRTFDICGGAKYTPDWTDLVTATAIEVKGEHLHSRDSRRRFDEAKHLFPAWTWIWARLRTTGRKGRRWDVEIYERVV